MKHLTIIIVNYHSEEDILNCLASAFRFSSAQEFEWVIVNNDEAADQDAILSRYPAVKWLNTGYNAGFARANNMGIKASTGDAVLLLNPDTLILDDAIQKCYVRLMKSNCIVAAVQLLNEDGSPQITGNYFMKGGLNHLLPLPYIGPVLRNLALLAGTKKTNIRQASEIESVDWINGAFLMVKKNAIEKAGLLDEDFFLYSEEIEWCSRLRSYGNLCVFGDLKSIHLQGETVIKTTHGAQKGYQTLYDKKGLQLLVSQHLRIRKQFGKGWFLFHLFIHTIEIPVFALLSFLDGIIHLKSPFFRYPEVMGYAKNIAHLWALAPRIWKNQSYFYKLM